MEKEAFDRLNYLSEKALNESATTIELEELNHLFEIWNSSLELNLFVGAGYKSQIED